MQTEPRPAITPQLVIGIFITLFGLALTIERLALVSPGHLRLFWPLALITLGIALLIRRQDSRGRFWGGFWVVAGSWLMLHAVGVITVGPGELIVPLIFILIGGTMVSRTLWGRPSPPARTPGGTIPGSAEAGRSSMLPGAPFAGVPNSDPSGRVSLFTIMGEAKRASSDKPFRGGEMTAIMGGCVLDLRQAEITPGDRVVLNVLAVMAGHEIWVPQGWVVASDVVRSSAAPTTSGCRPWPRLPPRRHDWC
jgi:hypothetical protein